LKIPPSACSLQLSQWKQNRVTLILQLWGGTFYLANKILFSLAEGRHEGRKRLLRMAGWAFYILGVPPWVMILMAERNWIAASIEAGGVPAMLFGLYTVYRGSQGYNRRFNAIAGFFTYGSLLLGVGYSLYEQSGINTLSQILELGVMVGFLVGGYLLARRNPSGWLFFMLMNSSMAGLMFLQDKPILSVQQLLSLGFVIYGYIVAIRTRGEAETQDSGPMPAL